MTRFQVAALPALVASNQQSSESIRAESFHFAGRSPRARPVFGSNSLFASVTSAFAPRGSYEGNRANVIDEATGTAHPGQVCDLKHGRCAQILGVGPRVKKLAGIKDVDVYSVGIYANVDSIRNRLNHHRGKSTESLSSDALFLKDFKLPSIEKEIRMVITFRAVSAGTFWKALSTRLGPALTEVNAAPVLPKFKAHFKDVKFHKGTEVRLALSQDGTVSTRIDRVEKGTVQSPELCAALTDIYVGADPPSIVAKQDFIRTVSAIVNPRVEDPEDKEVE